MADFYKAFEAIDVDGSGEITVEELQQYMTKNNYKENFVTKWLKLFDDDNCGKITYQHYCETLGLVPRDRAPVSNEEKKETCETKSEKVTSKDNNKRSRKLKNNEPTIVTTSEIQKEEQQCEVRVEKEESTAIPLNSIKLKDKGRNPKSYPIQATKKNPKLRKKPFSKHKRHLRASIQPGVVLILLTGPHKGKRVIFLKQLNSGFLLVTGPFKLNGCPLRRIHQKHVIATRTQIDINQVKVPDNINDIYFSRESRKKDTNTDVNAIFAKAKKEYTLKEERKRDQSIIDEHILAAIKSRNDRNTMVKYLKSLFSLSSHDSPHLMKF